jgi:hypothetical protein
MHPCGFGRIIFYRDVQINPSNSESMNSCVVFDEIYLVSIEWNASGKTYVLID